MDAAAERGQRSVLVAASLPPPCGSYSPDAFDAATAARVLGVLVRAQAPAADLWLAETLGCTAEARAAAAALRAAEADGVAPRPLWLAFSLARAPGGGVRLLSGERVSAAVAAAHELRADALLFNCAPPELISSALADASAALAALQPGQGVPFAPRLGAYANAFAEAPSADKPANAALLALRPELTPAAYARFGGAWAAAGASVVGGCCGLGPKHTAALREALAPDG